ncbi:MAG TPA: Asp-tRNA(Asn)/Glu-tRNA(Gln) amidotransferase subunit GatC [Kofleriaceae bacterium]|nr:Asp-tRNA(Asn)/Glu-tRNA(Gln) amidotransferase subunit GatC [Kofleriaceae bacterium]
MAALTRKDVLEIAHLARLHLEPDEADRLSGELSSILEHMEQLGAIDTEGVEPMTHAVPMRLRLRPDEVEPSLPVEEAVGAAPDRAGDLFQVPHIIRSGTAGSGSGS